MMLDPGDHLVSFPDDEMTNDQRFLVLSVANSRCPHARHVHDMPHEDGSPGNRPHHHHDERCERLTVVLVPLP